MRQVENAEATAYCGAIISLLSAMTLSQWAMLVGIVTAVATFFFNVWHSMRSKQLELELRAQETKLRARETELAEEHRREQAEEHRLRMLDLTGRCDVEQRK